jgi:hypothetical protein
MLRTSIPIKEIQAVACQSRRRPKMVIIAITSFPPEHAKEVGKRLGDLPPLPAYMTIRGPYVSSEVGVGIKVITVYEFDQSKTREAIEFVGDRYAKYHGVPGLTYSVQTWSEVKEALKRIGLG